MVVAAAVGLEAVVVEGLEAAVEVEASEEEEEVVEDVDSEVCSHLLQMDSYLILGENILFCALQVEDDVDVAVMICIVPLSATTRTFSKKLSCDFLFVRFLYQV